MDLLNRLLIIYTSMKELLCFCGTSTANYIWCTLMISLVNSKIYSDFNCRTLVVRRILKLFSFLSSKKFLIMFILIDLYQDLLIKLFLTIRVRYPLQWLKSTAKTITTRIQIFWILFSINTLIKNLIPINHRSNWKQWLQKQLISKKTKN